MASLDSLVMNPNQKVVTLVHMTAEPIEVS